MNEADLMVETHPFDAFVPPEMKCLIPGSFPGRDQTTLANPELHWFYGAARNQFWTIMAMVYQRELKTRAQKTALFLEAGIGIADVIKSCVRTAGTNSDKNLEVRAYNLEVIGEILEQWQPKVLFTSRFVEKIFRKRFPDYRPVGMLPSPSPRYFRLRVEEKARIYREHLPHL